MPCWFCIKCKGKFAVLMGVRQFWHAVSRAAQTDLSVPVFMEGNRPYQIGSYTVRHFFYFRITSDLSKNRIVLLLLFSQTSPCQSPPSPFSDGKRLSWCNLIKHLQTIHSRNISNRTMPMKTPACTHFLQKDAASHQHCSTCTEHWCQIKHDKIIPF